MLSNPTKKIIVLLQVLLWSIVFLIFFVYGGMKWKSFSYSFVVSLINFSFYAILIYVNSLFLLPLFYQRNSKGRYLIIVTFFFILVCGLRLYVENLILFPLQGVFYNCKLPHISLVVVTSLIAFLFGILLNVAKNYLHLLRKQEEIKLQQLNSEMNLLKQQVQPHFLYNTLNNIYSLANAKSDNTKIAIAKLAQIMRYFNEEAPKDKVFLSKEIDYIENYISLEQLRMVHIVKTKISILNDEILIPPMLLMPFVENVFKHGIDKTKDNNEFEISLKKQDDKLVYIVVNKMCDELKSGSGIGLSNLQKRLTLLYGKNYMLHTKQKGNYFEALMEIPI